MKKHVLLALPRFLLAGTLLVASLITIVDNAETDPGPFAPSAVGSVIGAVVAVLILTIGSLAQACLCNRHALFTVLADIMLVLLVVGAIIIACLQ